MELCFCFRVRTLSGPARGGGAGSVGGRAGWITIDAGRIQLASAEACKCALLLRSLENCFVCQYSLEKKKKKKKKKKSKQLLTISFVQFAAIALC